MHWRPLVILEDSCEEVFGWWICVVKICHMELEGCHLTCPWVESGSEDNGFSFYSVLLISEEDSGECGHCAGVGCGGCGGVWVSSNEELVILEAEGIRHHFYPAFDVCVWP